MALHLERGGIPLHGAVRENCEKEKTTETKTQVPSISVKR